MLNDTDLWPILCSECGHEMQKQIGWLKDQSSFPCEVCRRIGKFERETFLDVLKNVESTLNGLARGSRLFHKST